MQSHFLNKIEVIQDLTTIWPNPQKFVFKEEYTKTLEHFFHN